MKSIIQIKNLTFQYPHAKVEVIKDLSIDFQRGEFITILGPNGSGKSTLARLIMGILQPTNGTMVVDDIKLQDSNSIWELRKKVGIVFQNPDNQIVATTVEDDVAFGLENQGLNPELIRIRVDETLEKLDLLELKEMEPHYLSGGQKQKVAIAGILAMKPKIMIFDEATSMLDPRGRNEVIQTAKTLNREEKITVIHITHFLEETTFADRVIVMNEGKIILDGPPEEVYTQGETLKKIGLDVPLSVELSHRLIKRNIPLKKQIVNEEELVTQLWRLN